MVLTILKATDFSRLVKPDKKRHRGNTPDLPVTQNHTPPKRQVPCTCTQKTSIFTHFNTRGARHFEGPKLHPGALFPGRSARPGILPGWRQAEYLEADGQGTLVTKPRNQLHYGW